MQPTVDILTGPQSPPSLFFLKFSEFFSFLKLDPRRMDSLNSQNGFIIYVPLALAVALMIKVILGASARDEDFPRTVYDDPVPSWTNRPRPETFFVNSRGKRLYFELRGPAISDPDCKGVSPVTLWSSWRVKSRSSSSSSSRSS